MAKILVIDDNADLLQMMRLILEERGQHQVVLSADGADGLSRALTDPPDLAIVDVMMPGITGYDVVRRMREQAHTAQIPILILTARGQMIDRQTALQAGADEHMAKPVTSHALLEKVEELLAIRAPLEGDVGDGQTVSLLSLRGGVGVTTLAVNLALLGSRALGDGGGSCLVDLSPSSGQAALHLRLNAKRNWARLPELGSNPPLKALASLLTPHASGLQLLAAPFEPTYANTLSPALVGGALGALRSHFTLRVIDVPPLIDTVTATVLDNSDVIILIITPEVGAIQATVAMLQVLDEMQDKVWIVLNHVSANPGVPLATVEKALRHAITLQVPYDPAQESALAQGKPLAWARPSSPLVQAVGELFNKLQEIS